MSKYEVLAPVGDLNNFYVAINAGADAVYLGLNKFNARMKADNISLENIEEVVNFAHLKDVKVYVTLNTLVSDSEMKEVIEMVGKCLQVGVDAFIVQDYGIIGLLKKIYPNIVLHGSTQLGVHNVRGARVAKQLGLSRVVLSREVRIDDIRDIKENVDIELEVFVQGAMCVCFSGNCYLSSLKYGASGNRGECKQLCRLEYDMRSSKTSKHGYMLSPRDNCMLDCLQELMEIGVVSFKIEGRLRRKGYVNIATRTYRQAVDSINQGKLLNIADRKNDLLKVYSRGEFVQGYFSGNDIIDIRHNNHTGVLIGRVLSCSRFKDIYKIEILTDVLINKGDGLKFVDNNSICSLGVGNVDINGNKYIVYGKKMINKDAKVYRILDQEFENEMIDCSRYRQLKFSITALIGQPLHLEVQSDKYRFPVQGSICEHATSKGVTRENFVEQLVKIGDLKKIFKINSIDCNVEDDLFVPLSEINRLRRNVLDCLLKDMINDMRVSYCVNQINLEEYKKFNNARLNSLAIVDETYRLDKSLTKYDALILSPTEYNINVIKDFYNKYLKLNMGNLLLNMPIIAMKEDLKVLDEIVSYCRSKSIILLANNIYALDYLQDGLEVWAGSNINITNRFACNALERCGVKQFVSSIEKWCEGIAGCYKMGKGKRVLMTFAHCPNKTLTKKNCELASGCGFVGELKLKGEGQDYSIRRYRISSCYFELIDGIVENRDIINGIDDLRGYYNV